ncbi:MAG: PilT/PilU family type 4a pilus ATPase [Candidatus Omnitrophica bacterium]|nr:PilT/PilU family type 4a pilus ATPase [Candidatus Omnitrophota bacterium]MDD5351751.1 PilT/PilU family type 4a pilus ATPase [Candidatus Omnitrophota bacterium]MDD5550962.1 PilT/PilU family type 4a pilus ATPase [Candidatus Omnitrophota bacterium]
MDTKDILKLMVDRDASDLFIKLDRPISMRIYGKVTTIEDFEPLNLKEINKIIDTICDERNKEIFKNNMDVDFSFDQDGLGRFRVSLFLQRGVPSIVMRRIKKQVGNFSDLNLPSDVLSKLTQEVRGIVLLTGPAGNGKSTTIASMIEYMNENHHRHIITVEDPIEFIFQDKKSVINQRELGLDVRSYPIALRQITLQSPDVIFIGTIRDLPTMSAALIAAEMGILVLSTIHTNNSAQTVERIVNFFPPYQHNEIRMQLSFLLKGVVSLRLLPRLDNNGRIPACEVMTLTPTISRLIRDNNLRDIPKYLEEGDMFGMQSFKQSLCRLVQEKKVSREDALTFSDSREELELELKGIKRLV